MTTIASGRLSETLQTLVDARLDTIDRMLLGRVNRHDRLAIVREVESQIFDLLHGRDSESLDRDDVLAVLARLDPPEAYLPEESPGEINPSRPVTYPRAVRPSPDSPSRLPLTSGILGIVAILSVLLTTMLILGGFGGDGGAMIYVVLFGSVAVSFVLSLLAIIMAARVRLRGAWAVVGLVTGILAMLPTIYGGILLLIELS